MDLTKAFETVSHSEHLKVLERYGFRGTPHALFRSFLENRQQFVKICNTNSNFKTMKYGFPQATILGPIFVHSLFERHIPSWIQW